MEEPALKAFWEVATSQNTSGTFEALYRPGLVIQNGDTPSMKDSADGVIIYRGEDDEMFAIPIKCKARVSPNTFHKTIKRFNQRRNLSNYPGIGWNSTFS